MGNRASRFPWEPARYSPANRGCVGSCNSSSVDVDNESIDVTRINLTAFIVLRKSFRGASIAERAKVYGVCIPNTLSDYCSCGSPWVCHSGDGPTMPLRRGQGKWWF